MRLVFRATLVLFVLVTCHLGTYVAIDYSDGFNFLLQSRSLTDASFSFVPFSPWRPRGLVAVLTGFEFASLALTSHYPSMPAYHLLMAFIAVCYVIVWMKVVELLWGRAAGYVTGILLMSHQLMIHYAPMLLGDLLTGFFLGLCALVFSLAVRRMERGWEERAQYALAIAVGVAGGLAGLTKHHILPFLPVLLFAFLSSARWLGLRGRLVPWCLAVLMAYLSTLEVFLRVFSRFEAGLVQQLTQIFNEAKFAEAGHITAHTGPDFYLKGILVSWGPQFWALGIAALLMMARRLKRRELLLSSSTKAVSFSLLVTFFIFTVITNSIRHRELRYLLPLLPAILGTIAVAAVVAGRGLGKRAGVAWAFVWAAALIPSLIHSFQDLQGYYQDPIYQAEASGWNQLWGYFQTPGLNGKRCDRIDACWYSARPVAPFEFREDKFYRSYDLSAHYAFFTKLPVETWRCDPLGRDRFVTSWRPPRSEDVCYVFTAEASVGEYPHLLVVKTLGNRLSAEMAAVFQSVSPTSSRESVHCKAIAGEGHSCWSEAKFLERL